MTKIALLSDIHGNTTALEAVLEDSRKAKVNEYWLLGDSLMPGTGRRALLKLLEELPITVKVLGNWEDSLWRAMRGMLDETRSSHRYLMRQCQYILEEITPQEIEDMQKMPMQVHREIAGLKIGITHHLPDKNWGRELIHIGEQKDFDRLVTNPSCDIAVYGHIHQQFFRYGTGGAELAKAADEISLLDIYQAVECLGSTGQLFGFHEHPNPACPIGNSIHGVLDGKLEEIQLAMEKEMAQISLEQVVKEAKMKMEVAS